MATSVTVKTLRAAHRDRAVMQQRERPVTLEWSVGDAVRRVAGREGVAVRGVTMELGNAVDNRAVMFEVLRELLTAAPEIDTLLTVVERRPERWRLMKVQAGVSAADPVWVFECVEESS